MTAEPGPRYARLARPALVGSRARMVLALATLIGGILLLALGFIAVMIAGGLDLVFATAPDPDAPIRPTELAMTLLLVPVLTLPAAILTARLVLRMSVGSVCSVVGRFRWGWYVRCLLLASVIAVVASLLPMLWTEPASGTEPPPGWPVLIAIIVCCVPVQAFAEEFVFRGVLFQILGARWTRPLVGFVVPGILTSVLFALVHAPASWLPLLAYSFGGFWYALLCDRSGGLEASSAAHTAWNIALMVTITVLLPPGAGAGGQPASTEAVLPTLLTDVLLAGSLILLAHRTGVVRTTPAAPDRGAVPISQGTGGREHR